MGTMTRTHHQQKKAKKLKKNDEVFVLGKFCRVTRVHSYDENTTVHVKTFTSTDPHRFTVLLNSDVRVRFRPAKKN